MEKFTYNLLKCNKKIINDIILKSVKKPMCFLVFKQKTFEKVLKTINKYDNISEENHKESLEINFKGGKL